MAGGAEGSGTHGGQRATARPLDAPAVAWMVGLTFLWGLNAVAIKVLTLGMAPLMSAALRGAIATALLTVYGWATGERFRYSWPQVGQGAVAGLFFGAEGVLLYHGATFTNGGHISIFINTAPFFVALGAHLLLPGERMHAATVAGLALAFGGVVLLFSDQLLVAQGGFWRGDLLVMAAAAMWASSTLYIKGFMGARFTPLRLMWIRILISTVLLFGASLASEPAPFFAVTSMTIASLIFQGSVIVFFSYMMWVRLLGQYPASGLQPFTFLTPVWGVLTGIALLGETVSLRAAVGIVLIGGGLLLVNRPPPKPAAAASPAAGARDVPQPHPREQAGT